jgi:hypothetical protein
MPPARTTPKAKAAKIAAGLTEEERAALLAELDVTPESKVRRALSPRERVTASLMRERDHLDGCPVFEDLELGGARTEAYDEVKPAQPARGIPPRPVAILRCLECGGTRYIEDRTVADVLREELAGGDAEGDLDVTL